VLGEASLSLMLLICLLVVFTPGDACFQLMALRLRACRIRSVRTTFPRA
jgi:hypothetical protein